MEGVYSNEVPLKRGFTNAHTPTHPPTHLHTYLSGMTGLDVTRVREDVTDQDVTWRDRTCVTCPDLIGRGVA